jgi:hypothetical protein
MVQKLLPELQTHFVALCNWVHQKYFGFVEIYIDELVGQLFE